MEHGFSWVASVPLLRALPNQVATSLLVMVVLILFAFWARRGIKKAADPVVPDATLTARTAAEILVESLTTLAEGVIGHEGPRYVHLFASFFLFILAANLIGLVPGFAPPTDNFNITFGLGVVSFLAYNFYGLRTHGVSYVRQFLGPVLLLAPLMVIVEGFSHLFRPVSLGIRLFGNMFADHLVLTIFTSLTKVGVPVIFYVLGAFVSLVQALVFTLLSVTYVGLAVGHDH